MRRHIKETGNAVGMKLRYQVGLVQVDPINPTLKAPGTDLKLEYEQLLSNFGFKFNLRRYNQINFGIKPTDIFYPNLWQPTEPLTNTSREDGMFQPITHIVGRCRLTL